MGTDNNMKNLHGESEVGERFYGKEENQIHLGDYLAVLRNAWWKVVLLSLTVGVVTLAVMLREPNVYQSMAVITPVGDEKRPSPTLGALASFGIDVGGASKIEDLETLFKSDDLTVRVFGKHNAWPIVLADRFDPKTGSIKAAWTDRLFGEAKERKTPGDWDAIRAAKNLLRISVNRKASTISISFESPSPEGSAAMVKYYLDEGKSRLQEEALDRAIKNNKFIAQQIGRTVDALTRDRLYALYGQEVEREMLARNREQFGFRIIDSPRVPDRKTGPSRGLASLKSVLIAGIAFSAYFVVRDRRKQARETESA